MKYAYLFEARGIQRFLFATGKLKDMIAGSELVDYICSDKGYVNKVLQALNLHEKVEKPRIAGGVFYLVFDNKQDAVRFQSTWRVVSAQWLAGLERVDTIAEAESIKEVIALGIQQLAEARNKVHIELPNASPITERSPRTGLAAVDHIHNESIDLTTSILRDFERQDGELLTYRFVDKANDTIQWPNNFEKEAKEDKRFPLGGRQLVALIHADGNGLGEILRVLKDACTNASDETYTALYTTFSQGISTATVTATKQATAQCLTPYCNDRNVIPARPLVLGGDDLSIIVRADLAVAFTTAFLVEFKKSSSTQMMKLKALFKQYNLSHGVENLPDYLTACAGIVFMKASQPFYSASNLADGLCKRAKSYSRRHKINDGGQVQIIPSSIAFYKVNDSVLEDVEAMYELTQVAKYADVQYDLTLPAYLVAEDNAELANIEDLLALQRFLRKSNLNDTTLRELATLLYADISQTKQVYRRWKSLAEKAENNLSKQERKEKQDFAQFEVLLAKLIGHLEKDLPIAKVKDNHYHTVLGDLLSLMTVSEEGLEQKAGEVA